MPRTLIVLLILVGALGFIFYQLIKFFLSINNGRSRLEKEAYSLREKLKSYSTNLIPFDTDDFKSLSGLRSDQSNIVGGYSLGVLTTIFSEEMIKYGKTRLAGNDYSVMVVQTKLHDVVYLDFVTHTQVMYDGRLLGVIDSEGILQNKNNTTIASIDFKNPSAYKPIFIDGKEMGQVISPTEVSGINTRAFQLVKDMNEEESKYFLILGIYFLLQD